MSLISGLVAGGGGGGIKYCDLLMHGLIDEELRRIPLNIRAISAKVIYQKTTHNTVTF